MANAWRSSSYSTAAAEANGGGEAGIAKVAGAAAAAAASPPCGRVLARSDGLGVYGSSTTGHVFSSAVVYVYVDAISEFGACDVFLFGVDAVWWVKASPRWFCF